MFGAVQQLITNIVCSSQVVHSGETSRAKRCYIVGVCDVSVWVFI